MITSKMKRRFKQKFSSERPTVWVGKEGSTAQIVNEISRQLDQHEVVKGRILQAALKDEDAKEVATRVAKETESTLVEVRGHTFILYRRKRKPKTAEKTVKPSEPKR
ncbi:MAG TPA: YhbY family RNA-binding protein [Candidatus Bathyarchaeia archaeon]|nr:YhbY family RNA-binding protein [Candidatus Bathyarchaeia archaeon]